MAFGWSPQGDCCSHRPAAAFKGSAGQGTSGGKGTTLRSRNTAHVHTTYLRVIAAVWVGLSCGMSMYALPKRLWRRASNRGAHRCCGSARTGALQQQTGSEGRLACTEQGVLVTQQPGWCPLSRKHCLWLPWSPVAGLPWSLSLRCQKRIAESGQGVQGMSSCWAALAPGQRVAVCSGTASSFPGTGETRQALCTVLLKRQGSVCERESILGSLQIMLSVKPRGRTGH